MANLKIILMLLISSSRMSEKKNGGLITQENLLLYRVNERKMLMIGEIVTAVRAWAMNPVWNNDVT